MAAGSSASARIRLLVTGFGAFPGQPRNPSAAVVAELARCDASFARHGIALTTQVLPVLYDFAAAFAPTPVPDVIVHIGVAGRRRQVSIETQAHHRRSVRHADASGRAPAGLRCGVISHHRVSSDWGIATFAAALRRAGVRTAPSRDAGAYVCNALLYRSLESGSAPAIFLHIPPARIIAPADVARALVRVLPDVVARLLRRRAKMVPA